MIPCHICKNWVCKDCEQLGLCQKCYKSLPKVVVFALKAIYNKNNIDFFEENEQNENLNLSSRIEPNLMPDRLSGIY